MATSYPTSIDTDATIPDDPFVDGVSTGHNAHHTNIGGAVRALEAKVGIGSSTAAAATTGWVPVKQGDGTVAWAATPAGTPATTVTILDYTSASAVGTASTYAREDHKHRLPGAVFEVVFTFDTVASPTTGLYLYPVGQAATLLGFRLALGTVASAGSNTKCDLKKGGSTVLSTQPEIVVGQQVNTIATVFSSTTLAANNLLRVDITQGSSGAQLMAIVTLQWTVPA